MKQNTIVFLLLISYSALADTITLKNGDVYRGKIITEEVNQYVQILLKDDNEKRIQWADIDKIDIDKSAPTAPAPVTPETPAVSAAEPLQSPSEEPRQRAKFEGRIYFGSTFGSGSTYSINNNAGDTLSTTSEHGSPTPQIGLEFGAVTRDTIGAYLSLEFNKYAYPASSVTDAETGLYAGVRVFLAKEAIRPWIGGGAGFLLTSFGGPNTGSVGGYTVSIPNSMFAFALSPKFGVDATLVGNLFLSAQIGITGASGTVDGTVSSGSESANFSAGIQRWWWQANGGIGARF